MFESNLCGWIKGWKRLVHKTVNPCGREPLRCLSFPDAFNVTKCWVETESVLSTVISWLETCSILTEPDAVSCLASAHMAFKSRMMLNYLLLLLWDAVPPFWWSPSLFLFFSPFFLRSKGQVSLPVLWIPPQELWFCFVLCMCVLASASYRSCMSVIPWQDRGLVHLPFSSSFLNNTTAMKWMSEAGPPHQGSFHLPAWRALDYDPHAIFLD